MEDTGTTIIDALRLMEWALTLTARDTPVSFEGSTNTRTDDWLGIRRKIIRLDIGVFNFRYDYTVEGGFPTYG